MADDFNNDSLLELYLYESTSLLDSLDDILLTAEASRDLTAENVNEIFRIMHTIKGSSAMMEFKGISEVSHKTEDLFSIIRSSGLNLQYWDELIDIVLAVSDFLKAEIAKVQDGGELQTDVVALTDVVEALTGKMQQDIPEKGSADVGRTLGGMPNIQPAQPRPVSQPAPIGLSNPEPVQVPQPQPEPASEPEYEPEPVSEPEPEPAPEPEPEPATEPEIIPDPPRPEVVSESMPIAPEVVSKSMPIAPEGGRILGIDPGTQKPAAVVEPSLPAVTQRVANGAPGLVEPSNYFLHIHFNEGSKMESIRAFMLVNKLNEKGTVHRTIPANLENNPDAGNIIIERGFYVSFSTMMFREQIEALVKGTLSVETVSFVRKLPDDHQATANPPREMPAPEPRPEPIVRKPEPQRTQPPENIPMDPPSPKPIPTPFTSPAPASVSTETSAFREQRMHYFGVKPPENIVYPETATPPAIKEEPLADNATEQAPAQDIPAKSFPQSPVDKPELAKPQFSDPAVAAKLGRSPLAQNQSSHANQSIISVELKKLDTLLDLVGEIVINESIVTENPDLEGYEFANFRKAARQLDKLTNELQDTVMSIRMLPVSMVFQKMRRIVRDMSKSLDKEADLILVGETTEVDKTILDALSDPIMHLVRNAMDHAIESPADRQAAGKNPMGHIVLSAQNSGGDIIISISDDGKGLDKNVILDKARANGLLRKPESEYSDKEIYNLLMVPGFSTKNSVSEFSGRGVGMDVVKSNIEKIGGTIIIESRVGQGTNIIMKIPLTLAIISCIEIEVDNDIYSIPINNIRESFKASAGQVITDPVGNEIIMLRGEAYPIIRLYDLFGKRNAITDIDSGILVLADAGDRSACLLADNIVGKFQVVVKPLPSFLSRYGIKRSGISGCTIMGNGNISLILNVQDIVE